MKIIIVDELKMEVSKVYQRESYKKHGLFVVDDGTLKCLIQVPKDESMPVYSTPLEKDLIIKDFQEVKHSQVNDLMKMMEVLCDEFTDAFNGESQWQKDLEKKIDILLDKKDSGGGNMDARAIIEAITIIQKPELIKDLK